jgi:hypothetical protein
MSVSTAAICALTRALIETLLTLGGFEASMMLHEDYEAIGAYLYELNDTLDPGLGAKIIAAMGLHVPIDLRPEIEEAVARGGVISRRDLIAKLGRLEDRPEATYLTVYRTEVSYTIETPKPFPNEDDASVASSPVPESRVRITSVQRQICWRKSGDEWL